MSAAEDTRAKRAGRNEQGTASSAEQAVQTEQTNEWPSTYVPILCCSGPQCIRKKRTKSFMLEWNELSFFFVAFEKRQYFPFQISKLSFLCPGYDNIKYRRGEKIVFFASKKW